MLNVMEDPSTVGTPMNVTYPAPPTIHVGTTPSIAMTLPNAMYPVPRTMDVNQQQSTVAIPQNVT